FVNAGFDRFSMADDLHVDERNVRVAHDTRGLQVADDRGCALTLADLDVFRQAGKSLVRDGYRAKQEVAAADQKDDREDEDRAERLEVFAATRRPASPARYGVLRDGCASM